MATKTASGRTISAKAARGRGKLVAALQRQGLDPLKVREAAGYPNIVEWALYPQGAKRGRTGIVATLNGREWLDSSKASEVFSMGEGKSSTRRDVRVGDVIKVAHPATDGGFPWRFRFRFEGEQFAEVSGGREIAADINVVEVDSISDTINLVDYSTASRWLRGLTSLTSTVSGSASATQDGVTYSVDGTLTATATIDDPTALTEIIDKGIFNTPFARLFTRSEILPSISEFRMGGNVIGYNLPMYVILGAVGETSTGQSRDTYEIRSGLRFFAPSPTTETIAIAGVSLLVEIIQRDLAFSEAEVTSKSIAAAVSPSANFKGTTLDNGQAVIPPPNGWPSV